MSVGDKYVKSATVGLDVVDVEVFFVINLRGRLFLCSFFSKYSSFTTVRVHHLNLKEGSICVIDQQILINEDNVKPVLCLERRFVRLSPGNYQNVSSLRQ